MIEEVKKVANKPEDLSSNSGPMLKKKKELLQHRFIDVDIRKYSYRQKLKLFLTEPKPSYELIQSFQNDAVENLFINLQLTEHTFTPLYAFFIQLLKANRVTSSYLSDTNKFTSFL